MKHKMQLALVALLLGGMVIFGSPAPAKAAAGDFDTYTVTVDSYNVTSQNGDVMFSRNGEQPGLLEVSWSLVDQYSYTNASSITLDFIGNPQSVTYKAAECVNGCTIQDVNLYSAISTTTVHSFIWGDYNVYRATYALTFTPGRYSLR